MPYEKVGKNEPVCIADEVPFDIPESWEWVRLEAICTKLVDGDHNPPKGCSYETAYVTIDEQTFQPFNDCVDDKVHTSAPFLEKGQRVTLS